jgi:hypothetical protein
MHPRDENIPSSETRTTSTGNVVTTSTAHTNSGTESSRNIVNTNPEITTSISHGVIRYTTSRTESSQSPYNTTETVEMPGAFITSGAEIAQANNGTESVTPDAASRTSRTEISQTVHNGTGSGATYTTSATEGGQDIRAYGTEQSRTSHTKNYGSIVKDDEEPERLGLEHAQTSSTEIADEKDLRMERTYTSRSARERREFAPIRAGDAEELTRLASELEGGGSATRTSTRGTELQRRDTLAGINIGDAVLDPKSPEFDPYKWARM